MPEALCFGLEQQVLKSTASSSVDALLTDMCVELIVHDRTTVRLRSSPARSLSRVSILLVLSSRIVFSAHLFPDEAQTPLGHGGHSARFPFKVFRAAVRDSLAAPPKRPPHQGQSARSTGRLAANGRSPGQASPLQGHALPRSLGQVNHLLLFTSCKFYVFLEGLLKTSVRGGTRSMGPHT